MTIKTPNLTASSTSSSEETDIVVLADAEFAPSTNAIATNHGQPLPVAQAVTNDNEVPVATYTVLPPEQKINNSGSTQQAPMPSNQSSGDHAHYGSTSTTTTVTHIPPPSNVKRPNFELMKKRRVRAQFIAGVTGATLGVVFLGPLGLLLGVATNKITKGVAKSRECHLKRVYHQQVAAEVAASAAASHAQATATPVFPRESAVLV